jgi:hypothetical protein
MLQTPHLSEKLFNTWSARKRVPAGVGVGAWKSGRAAQAVEGVWQRGSGSGWEIMPLTVATTYYDQGAGMSLHYLRARGGWGLIFSGSGQARLHTLGSALYFGQGLYRA